MSADERDVVLPFRVFDRASAVLGTLREIRGLDHDRHGLDGAVVDSLERRLFLMRARPHHGAVRLHLSHAEAQVLLRAPAAVGEGLSDHELRVRPQLTRDELEGLPALLRRYLGGEQPSPEETAPGVRPAMPEPSSLPPGPWTVRLTPTTAALVLTGLDQVSSAPGQSTEVGGARAALSRSEHPDSRLHQSTMTEGELAAARSALLLLLESAEPDRREGLELALRELEDEIVFAARLHMHHRPRLREQPEIVDLSWQAFSLARALLDELITERHIYSSYGFPYGVLEALSQRLHAGALAHQRESVRIELSSDELKVLLSAPGAVARRDRDQALASRLGVSREQVQSLPVQLLRGIVRDGTQP